MSDDIRHLTDDQIQDWLDGRLARSEAGRLEAHLDVCSACRTEAEGWRALVAELSTLPTLSPSRGFSGRVLDAVGRPEEVRLPLAARVRGWLGGGAKTRAAAHVAPDALQDLLDGALRGRSASTARSHLAACESCRSEAQQLDSVMRGLAALPRLAPSPAFAQSVMARVRIPEPAPARAALLRRAVDRMRAFAGPQRRRAWAAAAGVALAPAVTVALVAYTVFSHPLVTVGTLGSFLWIKGGALAAAVGGGAMSTLMQSSTLFRAWSVVGALAQSPAAAGASLLGFSGLTLASAWVLYRNVISAPPAVRAYAKSA